MNRYHLQQAANIAGFSHYLFANSSDGWCVVVESNGVELEFYRFNELCEWADDEAAAANQVANKLRNTNGVLTAKGLDAGLVHHARIETADTFLELAVFESRGTYKLKGIGTDSTNLIFGSVAAVIKAYLALCKTYGITRKTALL
jgi:hypothetical protein